MPHVVERLDADAATAAARDLAAAPGVALLGLAGPPGVGKSTLAERLVASVPGAVLVGMDGFHLAHATLTALGRVERKGAPDTFDAHGYVALLRRVHAMRDGETVWAPRFDRTLEDPIAGAVAVTAETPLVVTEGNYLLLPQPPWHEVAGLLDACWYVDLDEGVRRTRLQARHERYGRSPAEARERTWGSDEHNAALVAASRDRATAVVAAP